jgi:predicted RNase H-like HicB family nuclease
VHKLQITAELTPDTQEGGYSVYCPELDIYSQGDTAEEAIKNLKEAVTGYIKVVGIEEALKEFKPPIRETLELAIP